MLYQLWFGDKLWESLTGQDVDISVLLLILLLWGSITRGLNGTYRQHLEKKETNPTVQLSWKHWQGPHTPVPQLYPTTCVLLEEILYHLRYSNDGEISNQDNLWIGPLWSCVCLCTYVEFFPEEFIVIGHSAVHLLLKFVDRKGRVLPVGARRASQ